MSRCVSHSCLRTAHDDCHLSLQAAQQLAIDGIVVFFKKTFSGNKEDDYEQNLF